MSQAVKKKRSKSRLGKAALVAATATALTVGLTGSAHAALLTPFPYMGDGAPKQEMFQPFFDYDSDGCYPAAAVDASGRLNGGLNNSGALNGGCGRDHLGKANTYSRAKCDNGSGWCGIVYTLYSEKDQGNLVFDIGHRHEWEAAVVWYHGNDEWPSYVSTSAHGNYTTKRFNDVEREGKRFKVVYHKEGELGTHSFRFAGAGERAEAWGNGAWDRPALVPYDTLWSRNRTAFNALANSDWGQANFPLQDKNDRFRNTLNKAKPSGITFNAWS
ncbi:necrosis inducing protein (NPP1) [Streptomyces sp. SA15]|uniref:NPP1 family protein n=1 Tax=Streptomyces sp. SA15 TaxID=934019 RepID=UPI000BAF5130|nr:NPP1 family protein [Streptomyces sp. SA15]PAZ14128.1 necrosis inducing protein (NPP1) [Streptomyces sp. SA15]